MISSEYAAGFFDGEGCIAIRYDKRCDSYILKVSVSNTCRSVLAAFQERWGGSMTENSPKKEHHQGWSDWLLQGRAGIPFLKDVHPYLVVKKEQSDLAFELINTYGTNPGRGHRLSQEVKDKRLELKEKLHSLKTKGKGLRGSH